MNSIQEPSLKTATDTDWSVELAPLLRRIVDQDRAALKRLYDLTGARLMGVAMRILQDEGEAADLLQEVYMKLWRQASQYSGAGSAWGWLCVLTRNAALDKLKSRQRKREDLMDDVEPLMADLAGEGCGLADQEGMRQCLEKLNEEPRKAILLSYIHGYSHGELETRLERPLGTIKAWIRRGLQELKQCLEA
ncbi:MULTISPECIES: RNA polymerase sigma factor [unclassified Hahella]|uniref:RNA polymerase sigma factor n=1 Tax=unclassified Hahella TaxID=2624107 RepID=UPI001C1EC0B5|nr:MULTISPECIES: sigma-70 family RNA polymerase sigma factor [unclassified Hahella]MBU6955720.1 sigma-70 family RNA polymerase sigma factor [Hahella sp. HN01]MDG9671339.1 sigma-70 family RNA polymerase sigma factor [Hahella sp. CR1]WLQ17028.1 sigma-70 family RNA polymerase sigma factor [Hahella sp. HNIBRBA332]